MLYLVIFGFLVYGVDSRVEKNKFYIDCLNIRCKSDVQVCGIRSEGEGFRIRLFQDECALLNHKCAVNDNFGYNLTDMIYCAETFYSKPDIQPSIHDPCKQYDCVHPADDVEVCGLRRDGEGFRVRIFKNKCELWEYSCENKANFSLTDSYICDGLQLPNIGEENKLRTTEMPYFNNVNAEEILDKSEKPNDDSQEVISEYIKKFSKNVDKPNTAYANDDFYIASDNYYSNHLTSDGFTTPDYFDKYPGRHFNVPEENKGTITRLGQDTTEPSDLKPEKINENIDPKDDDLITNNQKFNNIIVVRGLLQDNNNVNETIKQFFSATHVFDLPIKEMSTDYLNETTRRRLIKIAGPLKVFIPLLSIPNNISEDIEYKPTLNSCFHKCPRECPATYAPVCGIPGRRAREPTLMFLNHCFMDAAQCKQFYENKSPTSLSSAYTETTFVFCLGDSMNHMYHFLPLVKTLQHMGRLPKKGRFHYRLSNFKIFNNLLSIKNPNLMG